MKELLVDSPEIKITELEFFIRLFVVAGMGFLVGLEREYAGLKDGSKSFAGVRTFIFISILGFLGGLLYVIASPYLLFGLMAGIVALSAFSYYLTSKSGDVGGTTEVAALLVFALGAVTFFGFIEESLVITVIVLIVLSSKFRLHKAIGTITEEEMFDFIRFAVLALLVFPFLPNQTYGPYNVINPHEIGLVILSVSGIGFAGYILMKFIGTGRGILITGIIGGLASSTAISWVFSRKSKANPELSGYCSAAILSASAVMSIRVLILVALFNVALLKMLLIPFALIFVAAISVAIFYYKRTSGKQLDTPLKGRPLQLQSAIVFSIIYILVILLVSWANVKYGESGILVVSVVSGLSDIDAITISVSRLAGPQIQMNTAGSAILIATLSNTVIKLGIGIWAGSASLRRKLLLGYGIIAFASVIAYLMLRYT
jgi:uncharacterized membrane protein (DUF4010 family)